MERWESVRQPDRIRRGRERPRSRVDDAGSNNNNNNPSFSSTLLDAIYRSIDGEDFFKCGNTRRHDEEPARKMKPSEPKPRPPVVVRRKTSSTAATSSSSESSFGGFSSSDAESSTLCHGSGGGDGGGSMRLKPVRTGGATAAVRVEKAESRVSASATTAAKKEMDGGGGSIRSRLRGASKIYSDLKKVRPPVSPGGRLASFINSLFASSGNQRKPRIATSPTRPISAKSDPKHKSSATVAAATPTTSCSSASSYSRSCLSKNSVSSKSANGVKRTVRFYPVSVIVDEDCRPIGQKCIDEGDRKRFTSSTVDVKRPVVDNDNDDDSDESFDSDRASYSSSDLFELENFAERYREELPVYETTHLGTNLAIAKGLIV
ncbi:hypothetical protein QJS04_geneDACA013448 [Acorus gramineus]|uniref:Protein BIG GRAIN 1-like B n=1 Tax=Acorus gramineus TaxID=55184 RepID=A0AAV9AHW6_ACOGR|nr:hypothetical protein QJS04_geneDACA013448 [Acorus gramineus]